MKVTGTTLVVVLVLALVVFVLRKQSNNWVLQLAKPSSGVTET